MLDQLRTADLAAVRRPGNDTESGSLMELAIEPGSGPYAQFERSELRGELARALGQLPERERHILALYYEQELTLAEVGEVIGVSESRVSQLRTQATARLRSMLGERPRPREASSTGGPRGAAGPRRDGDQVQLPAPGSRLEGRDPVGLLPARPLRAQHRDVAVGLPAHRDHAVGGLGRAVLLLGVPDRAHRSEERRVGKECRSRWSPYH